MRGDRSARLRAVVDKLCSPECAGRMAGSREGAAARAYLAQRFEELGLAPAGTDGYLQAVPRLGGANVLGRLPGSGPLADRAVLVAAHYDHLGRRPDGLTYWGADDNAAALALLLEVAGALARSPRPLGRQVWFCAFDGEEPPHFLTRTMGSLHFLAEPPLPLPSIDMMVCMDLVGHAVGSADHPPGVRSSLFVLGAEKSAGTGRLVHNLGQLSEGLVLRRLGADVIPPMSDYHGFSERQIPFLFLTCGRWEHYHMPSDTPDRLDQAKLAATADLLLELTWQLSHRPEQRVTYQPDGKDDPAALAAVRGVAELLLPQERRAGRVLAVVNELSDRLERGYGLRASDRQTISMLVLQLEEMLQG